MKFKKILFTTLTLLVTATWAQQSVPTIDFVARNPLKLPKDMYLGEVSGVAINSKGHIFIFNRGNTSGPAYAAAAAQLLEFDAKGKFIREIGKNLYAWSFAHAVRIDKDDNIWLRTKALTKSSSLIKMVKSYWSLVASKKHQTKILSHSSIPTHRYPQ